MRNGQLFFDHRFDPSGQAIKDGIFLANRYFVCNPFPVPLQWTVPLLCLQSFPRPLKMDLVHFLPFLVPKVMSYDNVA